LKEFVYLPTPAPFLTLSYNQRALQIKDLQISTAAKEVDSKEPSFP